MVWFPRCPAAYLTRFTAGMLAWYFWLSEWGKSPLDFGLAPDDLDPRYMPAMQVLRREMARVEREDLDRLRKDG